MKSRGCARRGSAVTMTNRRVRSLSAAAVCLHSRLTVFLAYALLRAADHPNNMVLLLLFLLLLRLWLLWLLLLLLLVCCAAVLLWGAP